MTHQFKVGDKVRRVKGDNSSSPIGAELVIRSIGTDVNSDLNYWFDDGAWGYAHGVQGAAWELVIAAPAGPVVTETVIKTRILPGVYGRVKVSHSYGNKLAIAITGPTLDHEVTAWSLTSAELKAAAAVLLELSGALEA